MNQTPWWQKAIILIVVIIGLSFAMAVIEEML